MMQLPEFDRKLEAIDIEHGTNFMKYRDSVDYWWFAVYQLIGQSHESPFFETLILADQRITENPKKFYKELELLIKLEML